MSKPVITIIGLGVVGTSIGLALQREAGNFEIVGHDKNPRTDQVGAANWARCNAQPGNYTTRVTAPI